jgi:hypothetical protein
LFYFRFEDPEYAASRMLLVALDAAALIRTALDPRELGWLQGSAALDELERTSVLLLRTLSEHFPVRHGPNGPSSDSRRSRERWRLRYGEARQRLDSAGIPTRADAEAGGREYAEARATWEPAIEALAPALGYRMEEVDTAGHGARAAGRRVDRGPSHLSGRGGLNGSSPFQLPAPRHPPRARTTDHAIE